MSDAKANKLILTGIGILFLSLILLFALTVNIDLDNKSPSSFDQLGGDFTMQSSQGAVSLSDFNGKAVLLYFGFLHCPDVCPTSMVTIADALRKLPEDKLGDVQVLLVSVDHQRDTPENVDEYAKYFHPNITGLTDEKSIIDKVVQQYGAYYNISDDTSAENGFGVEHTTRYYMIDKSGQLVAALRASSTANELAAKLETII